MSDAAIAPAPRPEANPHLLNIYIPTGDITQGVVRNWLTRLAVCLGFIAKAGRRKATDGGGAPGAFLASCAEGTLLPAQGQALFEIVTGATPLPEIQQEEEEEKNPHYMQLYVPEGAITQRGVRQWLTDISRLLRSYARPESDDYSKGNLLTFLAKQPLSEEQALLLKAIATGEITIQGVIALHIWLNRRLEGSELRNLPALARQQNQAAATAAPSSDTGTIVIEHDFLAPPVYTVYLHNQSPEHRQTFTSPKKALDRVRFLVGLGLAVDSQQALDALTKAVSEEKPVRRRRSTR